MKSNKKNLLFKNIFQLHQVRNASILKVSGNEMSEVPNIQNAWLHIKDGLIEDYGTMADFPIITNWNEVDVIDCEGKMLLPSYVDSHTHLVFAEPRTLEFEDRINGLSYEEIALRGGGILNSSDKLNQLSENALFDRAFERLQEVIKQGTGGIEIKSGYGLCVEGELKMLRVIKRLKDLNLIPIKATFLGAHALPLAYKNNKQGYINLILNEMLPAIATEKLADFIDVFCEANYFTAQETMQILEAGQKYNLQGKVHAEQLSHSGGIQAAVKCDAISVDHLEFCNDADIDELKQSNTMPTILPGAAFFLNLPLPPARKMIDSGLPVAFASDYNPGSSPSGNMNFVMSLGCIQYKLTPQEMLNACTINSAYAINLANELGSITKGKLANIIITKPIQHLAHIPYSFGLDMIENVYINGIKQ